MEKIDRMYWRDRARAVLPSATSRELVRAARLLREQYDAPVTVYDAYGSSIPAWSWEPGTSDMEKLTWKGVPASGPYAAHVAEHINARAFDGREGGGVPDYTPAPAPYAARNHDMRGDGTVGKRGRARVQGGSVATCPDTPLGASVGLLSQMLEDLPRNTVGALAWDVEALTRLFYGAAMPELLGSDTIAYRQVVHAAPESDPYTARGVVGRESAEAKPARWATRTRLRAVRARKSETAGAALSALVAPADRPDRIFIGHKCQPRGKVATRKARQKRQDRTIGTATCETLEQVTNSASYLNRGERVVIVYNGVALTLTRGKSDAGTFGLTAPNGRADGIRTPKAVAAQALKLTA